MSNPGDEDTTPITGAGQLADYLAAGGKPKHDWRIGTEHEKFGFSRRSASPIPYEPAGIKAVLEGLAPLGWKRIDDGGRLIALSQAGRSISLEPGGQLELSGAPVATLHETKAEMDAHFGELREACDPMFIGFAPLGFHPTATRAQMPLMPKSRYDIMKRYMPKVGDLGLDMMLRTCTVQVNLDFADETDMVRKLRVSTLLQPVATALFANSPFREGKPSGYLSTRGHVWTDVDNQRSGMPAVYFEDGFGFDAYVEWLLDVPMYFVARGGRLIDVAGASFRRWLERREDRLADLEPTLGDFADHLTTAFPDVRLKRFLEMRGADAGSPAMMLAQSALWVGLLQDDTALAAAEALVAGHDWREFVALRGIVPEQGLRARVGDLSAAALARGMVEAAVHGLKERGLNEQAYLAPLEAIADGAPVQAEHWLSRYETAWKGDAGRVFAEASV
jgi:glutamate--cysteine ligase